VARAPAVSLTGWSLPAGTELGPYRVIAPLGRGGMGEVYRAHDTRLGREVAVKVLGVATSRERVRRFAVEARALAALQHPGILAVYDYGTHAGAPYLVTELLRGETLRERLRRGPLPLAEVLALARQVGEALGAAHAGGIVHRDLKPENLMRMPGGEVKLLDFGLAKLTTEPSGDSDTQSGVVIGTADYMSPEQVRGKDVDARADQFALAAVLCEALCGQRPFRRESAFGTMFAILNEERTPFTEQAPALPAHVEHAIERALQKDPAARFPEIGAFVAALENDGETGAPRPRLRLGAQAPPETRYARSGDALLAYQVLGRGPVDVVFVAGFVPQVDHWCAQPEGEHFFRRLSRNARVVLFDKRGTGLSDRGGLGPLPTHEERIADLCAVMDAASVERAVIFGLSAEGPLSLAFSRLHPERVRGLILYGTAPTFRDVTPLDELRERVGRGWGAGGVASLVAPSILGNPRLETWVARSERITGSPRLALALIEAIAGVDVRALLPGVRVPTLVLHRAGDRLVGVEGGRALGRLIPGATYVEYPGIDHAPMIGEVDAMLDDIEQFLGRL